MQKFRVGRVGPDSPFYHYIYDVRLLKPTSSYAVTVHCIMSRFLNSNQRVCLIESGFKNIEEVEQVYERNENEL